MIGLHQISLALCDTHCVYRVNSAHTWWCGGAGVGRSGLCVDDGVHIWLWSHTNRKHIGC